MKHKWLKIIFCLSFILPASCSAKNDNIIKRYLNWNYILKRAGDLHGLNATSNEVLDRNEGFTSYIHKFDKENSYINFQCKGTNYDDFWCEGSMKVCDVEGNILIDVPSFSSSFGGSIQGHGWVNILDQEAKDTIGTIYVYSPYWTRWQFEYDGDGDGEKELLTFEFWKNYYNPLPDFISE